jgi:hypothetical protein
MHDILNVNYTYICENLDKLATAGLYGRSFRICLKRLGQIVNSLS